MRSTTSFTTAMHRLADTLSWTVGSSGKTWLVIDAVPPEPLTLPRDFLEGLTFKAISLLCLMTRVAMSPERFGGLGWTAEQVRDAVRLEISRDYRSGQLLLPGDIAATDEATLCRLFKGVD